MAHDRQRYQPPVATGASLNHADWSLHRKGAQDQARHQRKVREALKQNLADIVSEQAIITTDGKKVVKVPIRSLEEYRFRYGDREDGRRRGRATAIPRSAMCSGSRGPGERTGARSGGGLGPGVRLLRGGGLDRRDRRPGLRGPGPAQPATEESPGAGRGDDPVHRHPQDRTVRQSGQAADDPGEHQAQRPAGISAVRRHLQRRPPLQDVGAFGPA